MDFPSSLRELYIETSHGFVHMKDVTIEEHDSFPRYRATGTIIDSCETSRLFSASSSKPKYPQGAVRTHGFWRSPDEDSKIDGKWHVSTVTCG